MEEKQIAEDSQAEEISTRANCGKFILERLYKNGAAAYGSASNLLKASSLSRVKVETFHQSKVSHRGTDNTENVFPVLPALSMRSGQLILLIKTLVLKTFLSLLMYCHENSEFSPYNARVQRKQLKLLVA